MKTFERLYKRDPKICAVIPVSPAAHEVIKTATKDWHVPHILVTEDKDKFPALKGCVAALAASGTVTLELALLGIPMVVGYIMHPITIWLGRLFVKTKFISLPNILLGDKYVTELIQEECKPGMLFSELDKLVSNKKAADKQKKAFKGLQSLLTSDKGAASEIVTDKILDLIVEFNTEFDSQEVV